MNKNINFEPIVVDGRFIRICIYDKEKDNKLPMGWVLIQQGNESTDGKTFNAIIYHLQVREQYRKMGYGKSLIEQLQTMYNKITTDYEIGILDSASTQLLFKCGFNVKLKLFKREPCGKLVWRKK